MQKRKRKTTTAKSTKLKKKVDGKKLYASRDAKGRFVDVQTYERAHRQDLELLTSQSFRVERPQVMPIITEKATATEIRKALGITPKIVKSVDKIMRDLEAKNWQMD